MRIKRLPTPDEIREARKAVGLTQTAAANLVYKSLNIWQRWEAAPDTVYHRQMQADTWELFKLKIQELKGV